MSTSGNNIEWIEVRLDARGRITIPEDTRSSLNIKDGDHLYVVRSKDGPLTLYTRSQLVETIRERTDAKERKK
jgi:AbrB family looped-hinge helix DNA binding protein